MTTTKPAASAAPAAPAAPLGHNGGPAIEAVAAKPPSPTAAPDVPDPYAARQSPETLGLVRTFKLRRPLLANGQTITEITVPEAEQHHWAAMQRTAREKNSQAAGSIAMLALMAKLPVEAVETLLERDHNPIKGWLEELVDELPETDPKPDAEAGGLQTWDCVLLSPIPTDGKPVTIVALREPDVAVGIATEKFRTEAEQTAAMIASLTGLTIPVVMRMKRRDVRRIERWLGPFSVAGMTLKKQTKLIEALLAEIGVSGGGA